MDTRITDLSSLERLFSGDRGSVEEWMRLYLVDAPPQFRKLSESVEAGNAEGLSFIVHDLRPYAHYLGSPRMQELLGAIAQRAKSNGPIACAQLVKELLMLNEEVEEELRKLLGAA